MTQLLKDISLEQSQMARLYAGTLHKPKTKIERGFFGIIKGDSITYQDESGTVTTKKLSEV
jgi:hypothetical protein